MPRVQHLARTLSYANRRRLEIARALVSRAGAASARRADGGHEPDRDARADRPDPSICAIAASPILLIEHKLDVVNEIADKVIVLDHGEKIAEGTPEGGSLATRKFCVPISDAHRRSRRGGRRFLSSTTSTPITASFTS